MRFFCHPSPDMETGGGVHIRGFWLGPAVPDMFTAGRRCHVLEARTLVLIGLAAGHSQFAIPGPLAEWLHGTNGSPP